MKENWTNTNKEAAGEFAEWGKFKEEPAPKVEAEAKPGGYVHGTPAPGAIHMKVGKALAKFGVELRPVDADGLGPGAHGSAWIAPADKFDVITKGLWAMGYRPGKSNGTYMRGPVLIEMGKSPEKIYLYISDDNGPKVGKKEAPMKAEENEDHPAEHYLVVENPFKPTTWHLRVMDKAGKIDHKLMGAAWAALHGKGYDGPAKRDAFAKLKKLYKQEKLDMPE